LVVELERCHGRVQFINLIYMNFRILYLVELCIFLFRRKPQIGISDY